MTTEVRTFTAESMEAALEIVRREMGHEAVILHTRQTERRRIWPWSRREQEVEITARLDPPAPIVKKTEVVTELAPPPPLLEMGPKQHSVKPPKWSPKDVIPDEPSPPRRKPVETPKPPVPAVVNRLATTQAQTIAARARLAPTAPADSTPSAINERLDQLQRMILELGRERSHSTLQDVPTELFPLFTTLIDADVDDELARELVSKARQHASPGQLRQPRAMENLVTALVERELKTSGAIQPQRGRRKVVALIGPTGVGKTTTLAKLAANFHLRDGVKLGLVTVDTYRIAAVEQLKTYAELIQLPMRVVTTPAEMTRAIDEFAGLDLVLIDTAGRSPQDELKIQELQQFLKAAGADDVHLVLSLTSSLKTLSNIVNSFQPVGVSSLILTKLDEAPGLGTLFNLARQHPLPISYITTGQAVPEDIEPAQAPRLARLVLGQESIGQLALH